VSDARPSGSVVNFPARPRSIRPHGRGASVRGSSFPMAERRLTGVGHSISPKAILTS
jgi:hypothetical protein